MQNYLCVLKKELPNLKIKMEGHSIKELPIIFKTVKIKTTTAEEGQARPGSIGMDKLEGL